MIFMTQTIHLHQSPFLMDLYPLASPECVSPIPLLDEMHDEFE